MEMIRRGAQTIALGLAWLVAVGCAVWAFGALRFDFPVGKVAVAWTFAAAVIAIIVFVRGTTRKLGVVFACFALVLAWWFTQKARNDRDWQPDVAQTAWAELNGDIVTLHNVRNCDYRTETYFTPRWATRTVRLSQLTGIDLAINYWGSPWMAHPIASFQFADAPPICFSIETRREVGEGYSAIGGLYRQFELIYVVADERDVIRVRTNYRHGEDVYLYRLTAPPAKVRERFMDYLAALNELHARPRWYNAVTTNCTTSIRTQHAAAERAPWDWRILINGKGDELLFERHAFATGGLPFAELRKQALINAAAQAADNAPDFSRRIRERRAGF
jgi:hypothetical protein